MFYYCCDNSRGATVLEKFEKAVAVYGLPSRVRGDCGIENFEVMRFMEALRGTILYFYIIYIKVKCLLF